MALLFEKTGVDGSDELKGLLGYLDADINFKNIKADINTATKEVKKLIGTAVYDLAIAKYLLASPSDEELEFINAVRYPIVVQAYRLYAPSNDLSHTNNGRKMRVEEEEKNAFEWMIDKDNKAQELRYYRALDDLIDYLDDSPLNEVKTAWKESDSYKNTHKYFIRTVDQFNEHFPIESRLLLIKLGPGQNLCEKKEIIPVIGQTKYEALKTALQSTNGVTDETDKAMLDIIREVNAMYAMAWAMRRFSVQLYPEGVLQHYTSDRATIRGQRPSLKSETVEAEYHFTQDYKSALVRLTNLVTELEQAESTEEITEEDCTPKIISGDKFLSS